MRILKKIFLTLLVIVLLLVVISFFLPRHLHVERSTVINAPREVIFEQVNTLKNWEQWSPWHKKDPNMKLVYEGPASGAGATYKWESNEREVGNGMLKITNSSPYDSVNNEMYFMESKDPAFATFRLSKAGSGTAVVWEMNSDAGMNPMMRWMGLMMDSWVGKDFEQGLANIKKISESMPAESKDTEVK